MSRHIDADLLKAVLVMSEKTGKIKCGDMRKVIESVDDIPTADVRENIKGKWINLMGHQVCSICGYKNDIVPTNFCPNCGADMRGEA